MAKGEGTVKIAIVGDSSGLGKALDEAHAKLSSFGSSATDTFKGVGAAMLASFGVGQIGSLVSGAFDQAQTFEKLNAQTNAAIKSTGDVSKVTSDQIVNLADSIQNTTSVSREQVQAGENMLLTFTNVRNGVGAGNDIFNQSTKILTDMSVALGQDMPSSAIQLGKALDDPIKGVTALQRVGVTFDQQQKDHIKTLVDSGNVMGAQKIILAELNKEFGGSAAALGQTTSGKLTIFKEQLADAGAKIAEAVLPALTSLIGMLSPLATWLGDNAPRAVGIMSSAFGVLRGFLQPVADAVHQFVQNLQDGLTPLDAVAGFIDTLAHGFGVAGAPLKSLNDGVYNMGGLFDKLRGTIQKLWTDVQPDLKKLADIFTGTVMPAIRGAIQIIMPLIEQVTAAVVKELPTIEDTFKNVFDTITGIIQTAVRLLTWIWNNFGTDIVAYLKAITKILIDAWTSVWNIFDHVFKLFSDLFQGHWGKLWGDLVGVFGAILSGIGTYLWDILTGLGPIAVDLLGKLLGMMGGAVANGAGAIWDGLKTGLVDAINWIIDRINDMIGDIPLQGHLGIPSIPKIPHIGGGAAAVTSSGVASIANSTPSIRRYHSGGIVPGVPGAEVLAVLQAGERVIPASSAASASGHGSSSPVVNIAVVTNATARDIAREASWALRRTGY